MKKILFYTVCLCTVLVAFTACSGKKSELIGKWEQVHQLGDAMIYCTYDFNSNKVTQTFEMSDTNHSIDIAGEGTCNYTFENDVITFKFSANDFNFSKFKMEGLPDDMIEMMMDEVKSSMIDVETRFTDVKISGDKLTAKADGIEITLTRL